MSQTQVNATQVLEQMRHPVRISVTQTAPPLGVLRDPGLLPAPAELAPDAAAAAGAQGAPDGPHTHPAIVGGGWRRGHGGVLKQGGPCGQLLAAEPPAVAALLRRLLPAHLILAAVGMPGINQYYFA